MARAVYVCPFTGMCGGTKVIAEHVTRLAARGHSCEWWGLHSPPTWFSRPVPYRGFPNTNSLGEALRRESNAAIVGTWWQTASWVAPNLRGNSRGYYLIQDLDELTYGHSDAGTSYRLGLQHVTESVWVTEELQRRYGVSATNVGIGIDHDVFRPLSVPRIPGRIFTTYRPGAGPDDLKGWGTALRTAELVHAANPNTSLVTFGAFGPPPRVKIPHIHIANPSDEKLRELYSQASCYLMTSRHEGFCLPALEAMACGCQVVCTDANGNREFCVEGETARYGLTPETLAKAVLIALSDGVDSRGREMAARYQWDGVVDRLEVLYGLCS